MSKLPSKEIDCKSALKMVKDKEAGKGEWDSDEQRKMFYARASECEKKNESVLSKSELEGMIMEAILSLRTNLLKEENTPEQYQSIQRGKKRAEVPKSSKVAATQVDTGIVKISKEENEDDGEDSESSAGGNDGGGDAGMVDESEKLEEMIYKTGCGKEDKLTEPDSQSIKSCEKSTSDSKKGSKVKGRDERRGPDAIDVGSNLMEEFSDKIMDLLEEEMDEGIADFFKPRQKKPEEMTDQERRLASIKAKKRQEMAKQQQRGAGAKGMFSQKKKEREPIDIGNVTGVSDAPPGGLEPAQRVKKEQPPIKHGVRGIKRESEGDKE